MFSCESEMGPKAGVVVLGRTSAESRDATYKGARTELNNLNL
jgi:hypothetical protein